ncbi:MAG: hypothetical protein AB7T06_24625 [Kofleriaceae bacterium]
MSRTTLVGCDVQLDFGTCGMSAPLGMAQRDGWALSEHRDLCPSHARAAGIPTPGGGLRDRVEAAARLLR